MRSSTRSDGSSFRYIYRCFNGEGAGRIEQVGGVEKEDCYKNTRVLSWIVSSLERKQSTIWFPNNSWTNRWYFQSFDWRWELVF